MRSNENPAENERHRYLHDETGRLYRVVVREKEQDKMEYLKAPESEVKLAKSCVVHMKGALSRNGFEWVQPGETLTVAEGFAWTPDRKQDNEQAQEQPREPPPIQHLPLGDAARRLDFEDRQAEVRQVEEENELRRAREETARKQEEERQADLRRAQEEVARKQEEERQADLRREREEIARKQEEERRADLRRAREEAARKLEEERQAGLRRVEQEADRKREEDRLAELRRVEAENNARKIASRAEERQRQLDQEHARAREVEHREQLRQAEDAARQRKVQAEEERIRQLEEENRLRGETIKKLEEENKDRQRVRSYLWDTPRVEPSALETLLEKMVEKLDNKKHNKDHQDEDDEVREKKRSVSPPSLLSLSDYSVWRENFERWWSNEAPKKFFTELDVIIRLENEIIKDSDLKKTVSTWRCRSLDEFYTKMRESYGTTLQTEKSKKIQQFYTMQRNDGESLGGFKNRFEAALLDLQGHEVDDAMKMERFLNGCRLKTQELGIIKASAENASYEETARKALLLGSASGAAKSDTGGAANLADDEEYDDEDGVFCGWGKRGNKGKGRKHGSKDRKGGKGAARDVLTKKAAAKRFMKGRKNFRNAERFRAKNQGSYKGGKKNVGGKRCWDCQSEYHFAGSRDCKGHVRFCADNRDPCRVLRRLP